jgi:hypothetical protein
LNGRRRRHSAKLLLTDVEVYSKVHPEKLDDSSVTCLRSGGLTIFDQL